MFSDPIKNLKAFGLHDDDIVADLGAGTGYYSIGAAQIVSRGKVYAVEVIQDYLKTIQNKIKEAHLKNIECLWGDVEKIGGTKIKNGILDAVIASNILFQVSRKEKLVEEVKRILKPNGRILLIDWSDGSTPIGANAKTFVPKASAREMFEEKGFKWERDIDAGAHHYGMIFIRQ